MSFLDAAGRLRVRKIGIANDWRLDLYHNLLNLPWALYVMLQALVFFLLNCMFATLYWLPGDAIQGARPGNWGDCFFFSVQTLATIGYGGMSPRGLWGNGLVTLEAYTGLIIFAMMSGLAFAKFSVPRSRVMFSRWIVRYRRDEDEVLQFRVANARNNHITEARISLTMVYNAQTQGRFYRKLVKLPLEVSETPVFALSFLATHRITEQSPLFGLTLEDLKSRGVEFVVTLVGLDDTLGQQIHARAGYPFEQLRWEHRFADTIYLEDGEPVLDLRPFHEVVATSP